MLAVTLFHYRPYSEELFLRTAAVNDCGVTRGYVPDQGGQNRRALPRPRQCQALRSSLAWPVAPFHRRHGVPSCQSQPPPPLQEHNGYSMAGAGLKRPVVNEQGRQKPRLVLHFPTFLMIWTARPSKLNRSSYALIAEVFCFSPHCLQCCIH